MQWKTMCVSALYARMCLPRSVAASFLCVALFSRVSVLDVPVIVGDVCAHVAVL